MLREQWSALNHLQIGRYAEYLAKMEFTIHGFDVFSAEVDEKGIDFVLRKNETCYYDVQVKSSRNLSYIFFKKSKFHIRPNLLATVVLFINDEPPGLYIIPSEVWHNPTRLFVDREYEDKKSPPEFGLNLSQKNLAELDTFRFGTMVGKL